MRIISVKQYNAELEDKGDVWNQYYTPYKHRLRKIGYVLIDDQGNTKYASKKKYLKEST